MTDVLSVLKLIDDELVPISDGQIRPGSSIEVEICFTCEDDTYIKCNIESIILVPWYKCPVQAISASGDVIRLWVDGYNYLKDTKLL